MYQEFSNLKKSNMFMFVQQMKELLEFSKQTRQMMAAENSLAEDLNKLWTSFDVRHFYKCIFWLRNIVH